MCEIGLEYSEYNATKITVYNGKLIIITSENYMVFNIVDNKIISKINRIFDPLEDIIPKESII